MRIRTALKAGAVLAAAVVVGLIAVVKSIDVNEYRGLIAEAAYEATGRSLTISGPLELALSLSPHIVASDVAFGNVDGGARPQMATVKKIEADISLLALLRREVRIQRLALVEPDILLEVDAEGRGNWEFGPAYGDDGGDAPTGAPRPVVQVGKVSVEKARIAFHDRRDGSVTSLALDHLTVQAENASGPIGFAIVGALNRQKIDISGTIGSFAELARQTKPFPVKVKAMAGGLVAVADGTVEDLSAGSGVAVKFAVEGTELADLGGLLSREVPALGPFRAAAKLSGGKGGWRLAEIDAGLGKGELVRLAAKGGVASLLPVAGIDLAVTAESANLGNLNKPFGLALPPTPAVKLTGQLTDADGGFRLAGLKGSMGKSDLSGDLEFRPGEARPAIRATLASALIDLNELLPPPPKGQAAEKPAAPPPADGRIFPDEPLRLGGLRLTDLDLHWQAAKLLVRDAVVEDADVKLALADGVLRLDPLSGRMAGGEAAAQATLDGASEVAAVSLALSTHKLEAGELLRALGLGSAITGGPMEIGVRLSGKGGSLRAIMAALDGEASVIADRATIENTYTDLLAIDVMRQLVPWAPTEDVTEVNCAVAQFDVGKGLAKARALLLDTAQMTAGGSGSIDLASERINLTIVPRPKRASLVNLAMPMDIAGTLASPGIVPNETAVAMGIAGAAAGAAIMPLGVLVPLITTGSGDENPCVQALAEAKKGAGGKVKQPGLLPDVGGMLQGIFGK